MCEVKLYKDWVASNHIMFIPDFLNIRQLVDIIIVIIKETDRQGPGLEMAVDTDRCSLAVCFRGQKGRE